MIDYDIDHIDSSWKLRAPTSDGQFINSGTPGGVPLSFDCNGRYYAWQYGKQIQPRHGDFVELFDALQLSACNYTRPSPPKQKKMPRYTTEIGAECQFYISADSGSDSNDGSLQAPFQTIMKGVEATRSARQNGKLMAATTQCTLSLMEGTYYQSDTIILTDADSYLTFQNYDGQRAVISGGVPLQFNGDWQLEEYKETQWVNYTGYNNVFGIANQNSDNDQCKFSVDIKYINLSNKISL